MSRLQQSTKPILLPLVSDADWSGLTVSSQRTIAAWAAMTCIVFEQADPPTASIPQADRSYLMAQLEPPIERWTIWMARFEGAADREFWHTGLYYWPLDDAHPDVYDDEKGQLATFRVGQAMLRVLSIPKMVALDPRDESMILHGFARIWPPQEHPVRTLQPLNDADASNFHAGFRNSLFGTKIGKWD